MTRLNFEANKKLLSEIGGVRPNMQEAGLGGRNENY